MKKFNFNLILPLVAIILLPGCMPNSLTKFTKDPPKLAVIPPVVIPSVKDTTGNTLTFTPPSTFYYHDQATQTFNAVVGTAITTELTPVIDGSLGNATLAQYFVDSCSIDTTGHPQTQKLPSDLTLNLRNCIITGTPLTPATVTGLGFCSDSLYIGNTIDPKGQTSTNAITCRSKPLVWDSVTQSCSNPDFQYQTESTCTGYHTWYDPGMQIPYRVKVSYHDELFNKKTIYTTVNIGKYKLPTNLQISMSDKILLTVTPNTGLLSDISPYIDTLSSLVSYSRPNIIINQAGMGGVAKYVDPDLKKIGINKFVKLVLTSVTGFTKNAYVSTSGAAKIGKIFNIDTTSNTLYIENLTTHNGGFSTGNLIYNTATGVTGATTSATISSVDSNYVFTDTNIDNDSQFYSSKFTVSNIVSVYEKDAPAPAAAYTIKPITILPNDSLTAANAVTYKISPALPAGLSFDTTTGTISGSFNIELAPTTFTITASNVLGSTSGTTILSSMSAPTDFNLTNKQIITVSSNALFVEGEELFQPITPPLLESLRAKILKKYGNYKLAIETYNGDFLAGASLDSGSGYISQKAFIIPDGRCVDTTKTTAGTCGVDKWSAGPTYYNVSFNVASLTNLNVGDYITNTSATNALSNPNGPGAKAIIMAIDSITAAPADRTNTIFVQMLTQTATGVSTALSFNEGNTIQDATTSVTTTISQVQNSSMKITLANAAGFLAGADITTSASTGAYTSNVTGSVLSVDDITTRPSPTGVFLNIGHSIFNDDVYGGALTTISAVTYDNFYVMERGKISAIHGNLLAGSGVTYSISPALPTGLVFDTATGKISGTPNVAQSRKDFVITATNFMGTSSFVTSIEVRDFFQLADKSGTSSFILHKVGDTQINRKCRINANDISSSTYPSSALDIRCYLDGQEEDIYFNKIQFNGKSGPGVCEYIQYAPFYFEQFSPKQSTGTSTSYPVILTVKTGCKTFNTPPTADLCDGNYTATSGPNCDEGSLSYNTEFWEDATPGSGLCDKVTAGTAKVNCGGSHVNCIAGPITKLLNSTQLARGNRSMIYNAISNFDYTWTLDAPVDNSDLTNLRVANGVRKNQCTGTSADTTAWATSLAAKSGTAVPFGMIGMSPNHPTANPYYIFNCLDAAMEVKARIRVMVRDWNKSFKINSSIDLVNPTNMDYPGTSNVPNAWNAWKDWDDDYAAIPNTNNFYPSAAYGGACGVIGAGTEYLFPKNDI